MYYPHPLVQDMLWGFLHHVAEPILARWPFSILRKKALEVAIEHVHYEDENSRYLCIGSVEKVPRAKIKETKIKLNSYNSLVNFNVNES